MSVSGTIRLQPFWEALKTQLATARMDSILGGAGRIYLATDDYGAPEAAEDQAWGRLVIIATQTLWPNLHGESYRWPVGWIVRAEVHDPGGRYEPGVALEAAQDEVYKRIDQWIPAPFAAGMIAEPIQRWQRHEPMARWDVVRGLWYNSAGYRTQAAPAPPA